MDAFVKEYTKLVGKKIVKIAKDSDDDIGAVYGLVFDDGSVAWILCDPEGNGPGFLELQAAKKGK